MGVVRSVPPRALMMTLLVSHLLATRGQSLLDRICVLRMSEGLKGRGHGCATPWCGVCLGDV